MTCLCVLLMCAAAAQAGVHSGDSACSIPTQSIPSTTLNTIREWTFKVAKALNVVGLINIQYAIQVRTLALPPTLPPELLAMSMSTQQRGYRHACMAAAGVIDRALSCMDCSCCS